MKSVGNLIEILKIHRRKIKPVIKEHFLKHFRLGILSLQDGQQLLELNMFSRDTTLNHVFLNLIDAQ